MRTKVDTALGAHLVVQRGFGVVERVNKKVWCWVIEACHGWFNRFRKLLVRYEKLENTFLAFYHLAAAIIALRKIELPVNIICG